MSIETSTKHKTTTITKYTGVDIGFIASNITSTHDSRVGKDGFDKNLSLEEVIQIAKDTKSNVIVKAGKNAKWYLKRIPDSDASNTQYLKELFESQSWRDTSRCTTYILS